MAGTRRIELRDRVVAGAAFADKPPEEDRTLHDMGRAGPDRQGMSVVLVAVNEALATAFENRPGDVVRAVKPALIAPGDEPGSGGQFTLRTDRALSRKESGRRQHPRRADGTSSGQDRNTGSLTGARCRRESGTVQASRNVAGHRATQPSRAKTGGGWHGRCAGGPVAPGVTRPSGPAFPAEKLLVMATEDDLEFIDHFDPAPALNDMLGHER